MALRYNVWYLTISLLLCLCAANGLFGQVTAGIRLNGKVVLAGDTVEICRASTAVYVHNSSNATLINWDIQGGTPSTSTSFGTFNVIYNTAGIFSTKQVVSNGGGFTDEAVIFIDVSDEKPTADFTFSPNNDCGNARVNFNNTSTGTGLTYAWDFGDLTSSTATSPDHQFLTAVGLSGTQTFTVKLTTTNIYGCTATQSKVVTVKKIPDASLDNVDPNVTFSTFNQVPTFRRCFNQQSYNFQFKNISTTNAAISSWKIEWGDGISPDSIFTTWPVQGVISHTYPLGNSTMTVTAFGTAGCNGIKNYNIFLGTTPAGGISSPGNTAVCAPQALTFALNGTANNSPGTAYTFSVNDGTPALTFPHPPPSSVTHDFITSSCGTTADGYANAFKVSLLIENPCGSTSGTVIPIYVSSKPRSRINIAPDTVICTGTPVTASYQYLSGGVITQTGGTGSTCGTTNKFFWEVSPSTGVTIGGTMGSTNGNPANYLLWTNGSSSLNLNFSVAGTYKVILYTANGCGTDTTFRTICVRTPPVAAFTMDAKESCGAATVSFTNATTNTGCNGNKYSWVVQYVDALGCGSATNAFQFLTGSNSTSVNPKISFNNPGKYYITLTSSINSSVTNCNSVKVDSFMVKGKPKVAISPVTAICVNNSMSPVANVSNCYGSSIPTYSWSFANGSPASANTLVPGAVTFTTMGSQVISLAAENECGITTGTVTLAVTNPPVADAGADKSMCSGTPVSIGSDPVAAVTYQWTPVTGLTNPNSARTNVNFLYNGANADTTLEYIVRASAGSSCTSTDTVLVTVKKAPQLNVFPAVPEVCAGSTVKLYVNGGDTYTWAPATGLNTTTGDTVYATLFSNTTYTVTSTITSGGCAAAKTLTITVKPLPATNAGKDSLVCAGSTTVQLSGSPTGGTWTGTNISATGLFNAQAAALGSFSQYYTASLNGCSKSDTMVVTVIQQPVASTGTDTTVCTGSTAFTMSALPIGGSWSGTSQVTPAGVFTPTIPGTYTLTYTIGAGTCMASVSRKIIVQPGITNNIITANQAICIGNAVQPLTGTIPAGGDGNYTYQWQSSIDNAAWTNISSAIGVSYQPPTAGVTMYYRRLISTSLCANNTSNSVEVKINLDAKAAFTVTNSKGCAPFNINNQVLKTTLFPDNNASYQWYANGVLLATNTTGAFPGYVLAKANDSVTIKLVTSAKGGCKPDSTEVKFYTVINPKPAFTQNITGGCGPVMVTFTNTTPDLNNYNYIWDFGNGSTSTLNQPGQVVFQPHPLQADTVYTIKLKATGGCDTIVTTLPVSVKSKPKSLFTPDKSEGCSPMKVTFQNTSRGNGNSYEWHFGDGSPLSTSNGAQVHSFTVSARDSFKVRLVSTNACGNDTLIYAIIVNPNSIKLDFALNGNDKVGCLPHTVRFINNSSGANNYNWDFGDGTLLATLKGIDTIVHTYTKAGVFDARLQGTNTCNDTTDHEQVSVLARPKVAFTANPTIGCATDSVKFSNQSDPSINYVWSFGDGSVSGLFNPVKYYGQPGTYKVALTGSKIDATGITCSDTASRDIVINGAGGSLRYTGGYACLNSSLRFEGISSNATQYRYVFGDGDSLTTTSGLVNHQYQKPGLYVPMLTLFGGNCLTKVFTGDTIKVDRIKAGFKIEQEYQCGRTIVKFVDTSYSFFAKSAWQWNFGDNTFSSSAAPQRVYTQAGVYSIKLTITGVSGCTDTITLPLDVKVRTVPASTISSQATGCSGEQMNFTAGTHSTDSIASFQWNFGNGNTANGKSAQNEFNAAGNYTIRLISRTIFGCADTVFQPIVIQSSPVINAGTDARICRGANVFLQATGAATYHWFSTESISCTNCAGTLATPQNTTTYVVAGTNALGCTAFDSVTVNVIQPFNIALTVKDTICLGQSTQLLALNADRYVWSPEIALSNPFIANPVATPLTTTPYKVVGYDRYGCFTDSTWVFIVVGNYPTIKLSNGGTVVAGTPIHFQPLIANGPVKKYTWTPNNNMSCTNCASPVVPVDQNTLFKLEVENVYGCKASDTVSYKVYCDLSSQVFVPNAFTPDGDGVNDVLMVRGKGISVVKYFRIFNRWGQLVYERSNVNVNDMKQGWDGRINGIAAQPDVYVYTVEMDCTAGGVFVKKGNITLIR